VKIFTKRLKASAPLQLARPGEDGGEKFRVWVAPSTKVSDNGRDVERHAALRDGQLVTAIVQQKPVGHASRTRQPGTARIEGANAADAAIGRRVRMTFDDDIGAASGEQLPKLIIVDARLDTRPSSACGDAWTPSRSAPLRSGRRSCAGRPARIFSRPA
jgi:hypothetical protein